MGWLAAVSAITGEPLARDDAFSQVLEIALAIFSVAVFATLAGSLGAYFLETRNAAGPTAPAATDLAQDQ